MSIAVNTHDGMKYMLGNRSAVRVLAVGLLSKNIQEKRLESSTTFCGRSGFLLDDLAGEIEEDNHSANVESRFSRHSA